jgi:hypothetical protein
MRYEEAYLAFRDALTRRGNSPEELASIYKHLGVVAAYLDRPGEAVDHFTRWLCIYPDATLAEGFSPKVEQPFHEAQQRAKSTTSFRLVHIPVSQLTERGGLELEAELVPDSLGLATGLTLRYREADAAEFGAVHKEGTGPLVFSVAAAELPAGKEAEYFLQITEAHGGVLWEFGSARAPIRARPAAGAAPVVAAGAVGDDDAADVAFYTQPWFFIAAGAGAALVLAGGAVAVAIAATADQSEGASFGAVGQEVARAR